MFGRVRSHQGISTNENRMLDLVFHCLVSAHLLDTGPATVVTCSQVGVSYGRVIQQHPRYIPSKADHFDSNVSVLIGDYPTPGVDNAVTRSSSMVLVAEVMQRADAVFYAATAIPIHHITCRVASADTRRVGKV